jgi:1,2-beta-oligoglucan phosphorylase
MNRNLNLSREGDLGLTSITSRAGLTISALPNGCLFAIECTDERGRVMINQVLGSPVDGGIGRMVLRIGGAAPTVIEVMGPGAKVRFGAEADRFVWDGETRDISHRLTLWLHPQEPLWLWHLELALEEGVPPLPCDVIFVQDIGLGDRGFLMGCEAFASQYIDHHIASHPGFGPVIMNRQNLAQGGRYPWIAHGCLDGAAGYATDALQLFGPAWREASGFPLPFGTDLPNKRLQHELACPTIRSRTITLMAGGKSDLTFFGLYQPNHPTASSDSDLKAIDALVEASRAFEPSNVALSTPSQSLIQAVPPLNILPLPSDMVATLWPERTHEEHVKGTLLSFFVPEGVLNRHVVLGAKERATLRRHGAILRSGQSFLPDDSTLCATAWMHGIFGAQLVLGNTSLHKLTSVARDPYNIMRANGLRILADTGEGWRLLAIPSAFDMGLNDCRWIYHTENTTITVHTIASGSDTAMQWRITADGHPCRFLVLAHLVMGERDYEHKGRADIDVNAGRATLHFDSGTLWGNRYPQARFDLVTSTLDTLDAMGGNELLFADGKAHGTTHLVMRTKPTEAFTFAFTGSLTSPANADALAVKYSAEISASAMLAPATDYWHRLVSPAILPGDNADILAHNALLPWLVQNAIIHLTAPHGLEQFSGAAWGTRDVCQGPVELLLALKRPEQVKNILRIVFAQQFEDGDWPQWFMLEPYENIRALDAHGDIIVWPLKALCDYIEATGDLAFFDETVPWRRRTDLTATQEVDTITAHVERLLSTVESRFIPGTYLMRLGEGDWNDALQPANQKLRETMVSSWTVALLYQQLERYIDVLRGAGHSKRASEIALMAGRMLSDFQRHLIEDDTVAGYALFYSNGARELIMHPNDRRTGVKYSMIPMTRGILSDIFSLGQMTHHIRLIREHLLFPDGVRLMDRPVAYHGGLERVFRRAESAAFFGREIALMYTHAHLRYCDAMAARAEWQAMREGLATVNPILMTQALPNATLRQRNTYFTSSDAAFADRYQASAEWDRVKAGTVPLDGGWRIYSSGPGIYVRLLVRLLQQSQRK